ncbi:MAG: hypothetical protein ACREKR_12580 [Candidatus Methylomirabilales bacterium]
MAEQKTKEVTLARYVGRKLSLRGTGFDTNIPWTLVGVDQGCLIVEDGPSGQRVEAYIFPLASLDCVFVIPEG